MPGQLLLTRQYLAHVGLVAVAYFLGGKLGLQVPFTHWNVSPVWPAAGIALAAVLLWGTRIWPGIALGAFAVNFFSPISAGAAMGITVGNTLSAVVAGYFLPRAFQFDASLRRLRDVMALALFGAGICPAIAATGGTATLYLSGLRPWSAFSSSWLMWWAGDAVGILLFAPLMLTVVYLWRERLRPAHVGEAILVIAGAVAVCFLVFDNRILADLPHRALAFGLFPFVTWSAIRLGVFWTSVLCSGLALIAVWETASGRGAFVQPEPLSSAALFQIFLALLSLTGTTLAVVVGERDTAEQTLAREKQLIRERDQAEAERRSAEEALLRNERLAVAGRLAATIAHEINNPLSAITNVVHLLSTEPLTEDKRRLVDLLAKEVDRVSYVAKHTLSYYRESVPPVRLKLADVIEEVLNVYPARFRDIAIEKRFNSSGEVEAFPVEMHQVFSNVLLNAAEATTEAGHVVVEIRDAAAAPVDSVQVTIRDNGKGIPEAIRGKIFQPFFSTKSGLGVGVGLWIIQGIVRKHGGQIHVASNTDGHARGTEFTIVLPKRYAQPDGAAQIQRPSRSSG